MRIGIPLAGAAVLAGVSCAVLFASRTSVPPPARPVVPSVPPAPVLAPDPALVPALEAPAPAPFGTVAGSVRRNGAPAAAEIAVWLLDGAPVPFGWWYANSSMRVPDCHERQGPLPSPGVRSGADGTWSCSGLAPGLYLFEALGDDGSRGWERATVGEGSPKAPLTLRLRSDSCVLRGRATLPDGTPWTGWVEVDCRARDGAPPPPVRPGPDGRFRIEGLPPRIVELGAFEPGQRHYDGPDVLLPFEDEVDFVVGRFTNEAHGQVVAEEDARPIAGALVVARYGSAGAHTLERAVTDGEGRFTIHPPPRESRYLEVDASGFAPHRPGWRGEVGGPAQELIRLQRPAALRGRTVDATSGRPIPGVPVHATRGSAASTIPVCVSDAEGRFSFPALDPGEATLVAFGNGWVSGSPGGERVWPEVRTEIEAGAVGEKDVPVIAAHRVSGRVLDPAGRGVADVAVRYAREHRKGDYGWFSRYPAAREGGEVRTGADGSYRILELWPDESYALTVARGGACLVQVHGIDAVPGIASDVDLRLPPTRDLSVRVVESAGDAPVPGATVILFAGNGFFVDFTVAEGWTDAEGRISFPGVPATPLRVHASREPGRYDRDESASVELDAADVVDALVRLPTNVAPRLSISGRVVLPDGSPVQDARCEAHREGADPWDSAFSTPGPGPCSDSLGRFRVDRLPAGKWRLEFVRHGENDLTGAGTFEAGARDALVVMGSPPEEVEVSPGPTLEVTVLGVDGRPLAAGAATVHALAGSGGGYTMGSATVEAGHVRLSSSGGGPSTFWVEVRDASGTPAFGHGLFGPLDPARGPAELRVEPEQSIEGIVLDEAGRGVADADVEATVDLAGFQGVERMSPQACASAKADVDGRFRLRGLGARAYLVACSADGCVSPPPFSATPGGQTRRIVVRREVEAVVKVLDPEGRPVARARVYAAKSEGGWAREGNTGKDGTARLDGLDPGGEYTLSVSGPEGAVEYAQVLRRSWVPADTEVRLEHGHSLEVIVRDPRGAVVPDVVVGWWSGPSDGPVRTENTGDDGVHRFSHLPPGEVLLRASFPESTSEDWATAPLVVAPGARSATLVLDPEPALRLRIVGATRSSNVWVEASVQGEGAVSFQSQGTGAGTVCLRGLRRGAPYDVALRDWSGRRGAVVRGIVAGGPEREVVLLPVKELRGHVSLPEGVRDALVSILVGEAGLLGSSGIDENGAFEIGGVPEGKWRLRVTVPTADGDRTYLAEAEAGGTVEIDARGAAPPR